MDQLFVSVERHDGIAVGQLPGVPGGRLRGGQRTRDLGSTGALDQSGRRGRALAGGFGEVGGELARRPRELGVGQLEGGPGPAREIPALGREQVVEDRLAGEGVTESEPVAIHLHELGVDGGAERVDRRPTVDVGDAGEEVPLEEPAEQAGRTEHPPGGRVELLETAGDRVAQARRYRRGQRAHDVPVGVGPLQRARRDQPGEQLLHQERAAVAVGEDEVADAGRRVGGPQAGGDHAIDRRGIE